MLAFLFKLTLCWSVFALLYWLLLRRETFFRANRLYLLGTYLLGIVLALAGDRLPDIPGATLPGAVLPEVEIGLQEVEHQMASWSWSQLLLMVYMAGVLLAAARFVWGLYRIAGMMRRGRPERLPDGCLLIRTEETAIPFSFFNRVFVPVHFEETPEGFATMLEHERAHAKGWHSTDVLLLEIGSIIFWFHPLVHWYRNSLRTVHEYLADARAVRHASRKQYGLMLLRQTQGSLPLALANHFYQSPLHLRLLMLTRRHSSPMQGMKYLLTLPLLLLFTALYRQAPVLAQQTGNIVQQSLAVAPELQPVENQSADKPQKKQVKTPKKTAPALPAATAIPDRQPEYPGGINELMRYLGENTRYPDEARADKAQGMVVVQFIVGKNGEISEVQVPESQRGVTHTALQEAAVAVVQNMPSWQPALQNGEAVKYQLQVPIRFKLE